MSTAQVGDKQRENLEALEDALDLAIQAAGRVHVTVTQPGTLEYLTTTYTKQAYSETVGDLLQRARGPVRTRLNAIYADEVRQKRGRE